MITTEQRNDHFLYEHITDYIHVIAILYIQAYNM